MFKDIFGASAQVAILGFGALLSSGGAFLGLAGIALIAQFDGDPATVPNWDQVYMSLLGLGTLLTSLGVMKSRANNVSSEAVQATGVKVEGH